MSWLRQTKELGLGGCAGALVGMILAYWINPTTSDGTGLIIVISTLGGLLIGAILRMIWKS